MQTISAIFQIAFWMAAGSVAILTYLQAKNGLLQPIRTEVFKIQVEEIRKIIKLFIGKGEIELCEQTDIFNVLHVNNIKMFDQYIAIKFGIETDYNARPYSSQQCSQMLATMSWAQKKFH